MPGNAINISPLLRGKHKPGVNPFKPILDTNPAFWIDASNSIATTDVNRKISQYNDLIGSFNATQATAGKQPTQFSMGSVKTIEFIDSEAFPDTQADMLLISNSFKTFLQSSFTMTFVTQPYDRTGDRTYFGVVDSIVFYVWQNDGGSLTFRMLNGSGDVTLTTASPVIYAGYNPKPIVTNAVFDSTVNGVGGIKLYVNNVLQSNDGSDVGNTSGYNAALMNPPILDFGWAGRNRVTGAEAYFKGMAPVIGLHSRVISPADRSAIYEYYLGQN